MKRLVSSLMVSAILMAGPAEATRTKYMDQLKTLEKKMEKTAEEKAQYLILTAIYAPEKTNTTTFEETAKELDRKIIDHFEDITSKSPYVGNKYNYSSYKERTKEDPVACFKNPSCLLPAMVIPFGFMRMGDIVIPCKAAIETETVSVVDGGGGGHGASTAALSDCAIDPNYAFPRNVEEYYNFVRSFDYVTAEGSIKYLHMAINVDADQTYRYMPKFKDVSAVFEYPFYDWGLASYPNYKKYRAFLDYGIGFERAHAGLSKHYQEKFGASKEEADGYAIMVLTPLGASRGEVKPDDIRQMILSGEKLEKIKTAFEMQGDPRYPRGDQRWSYVKFDTLLHLSVMRPDVMRYLLERCKTQEGFCRGINVNTKNMFDKTPLMYAAQYNAPETLRILIENGADINAQTSNSDCYYDTQHTCMKTGKRSALMYAIQEGNYDIAVELIRRGADKSLKDTQGKTASDYLSGKAPYWNPSFKIDPMGVTHGNYMQKNDRVPPFTEGQRAHLENLLD